MRLELLEFVCSWRTIAFSLVCPGGSRFGRKVLEPKMKNITAILFDLDGTLCETGGSIIKSYLFTLEQMGVTPPPFDSMKKFVGPPLGREFQGIGRLCAR